MACWFTGCQRRPNQPVGMHRHQAHIESRLIGIQVADGDQTNSWMCSDLRAPGLTSMSNLVSGWQHGNPPYPACMVAVGYFNNQHQA